MWGVVQDEAGARNGKKYISARTRTRSYTSSSKDYNEFMQDESLKELCHPHDTNHADNKLITNLLPKDWTD
jgi:hypothetical protein